MTIGGVAALGSDRGGDHGYRMGNNSQSSNDRESGSRDRWNERTTNFVKIDIFGGKIRLQTPGGDFKQSGRNISQELLSPCLLSFASISVAGRRTGQAVSSQ